VSAAANNIEGKKFGELIALRPTSRRTHNKTIIWECKCLACGKIIERASSKLTNNEIKSCGCLMSVGKARKPAGHSGASTLYNSYRYAARVRDLAFNLSLDNLKELCAQNCTYCGIAPYRAVYGSRGSKYEHGKFIANGIDRVDNTRGYDLDNCVPCCPTCNIAKAQLTVPQFREWAMRVASHLSI
jgi:hypothetical protein